MGKRVNFTITPVWAIIEHMRKQIQSKLEGSMNTDDVKAAEICAVELAENAVKYGESIPDMEYIQFQMEYENDEIEMRVSNGVVNQEDIDNVRNIINNINGSPNPKQLYINRLNELVGRSMVARSQLGLLRIAHETEFEISYEINQNALTIVASRRLV